MRGATADLVARHPDQSAHEEAADHGRDDVLDRPCTRGQRESEATAADWPIQIHDGQGSPLIVE